MRQPILRAHATRGLALAVALSGCQRSAPALVINELLAANQAGLLDEDGQAEDWFELYNPTEEPVALDGWWVGPDATDRVPLPPSLEVPPRGFLVLVADGDAGDGHVGFSLAVAGESLTLFSPDLEVVDTVTWGPLIADHALARAPDGGADWAIRPDPTPGAPNGGAASGSPEGDVRCALTVSGGWRFTEGDRVALGAACDEPGRSFAWFGPEVQSGPDFSWRAGVADAGTREVLVAASDPAVAGVPVTSLVVVSVADGWADPENVPVDPATYTTEWGVPVLHLDVGAAIPEEYVPAVAWFDGERLQAQLKVRGAASAGFPKPSYTVEFDPVQLDLGPWGLSKQDHLVLVSNFDDPSHLRQRVVYDTWAAMAAFWARPRLTPRTAPMVVYVDGAYRGLYLALDHVDDEFLRQMGLESGGNLYKSVSHDANFFLTNAWGYPKTTLHDGWEKKEGADLEDFSDLDALTAWVGSASHDEFAAGVDAVAATDEFMDWYHLVSALACDDSVGKNAYLYADPTSGLWRYVPWDFNAAIGQSWTTARRDPWWVDPYTWYNGFFWHFQEHPPLAGAFWERGAAMRAPGGPLSLDALLARVADADAAIAGHPDRDWARWEAEFRAYPLWAYRTDVLAPAEERAYLDAWLVDRDAALASSGG